MIKRINVEELEGSHIVCTDVVAGGLMGTFRLHLERTGREGNWKGYKGFIDIPIDSLFDKDGNLITYG